MTGDVSERFARLPHDEFYDDWAWGYILGSEGDNGAVNHGQGYQGADEFDPTQVAEVVHWHTESSEGYASHDAAGVFRMEDGTFVAFTAWTDTTGWGCQDDARLTFHPTLDHAEQMGLDDEHRRWFGIAHRASSGSGDTR